MILVMMKTMQVTVMTMLMKRTMVMMTTMVAKSTTDLCTAR